MNVGELLRERDRLLGVMEEAKSARAKLKQVNVLIALYGDAAHVDLVGANGKGPVDTCDICGETFSAGRGLSTHKRTAHQRDTPGVLCDTCGAGPFKGSNGLSMHNHRVHTGRVNPAPSKRKGK